MNAALKEKLKAVKKLYGVALPFMVGYRRGNMLLGKLFCKGKKRVVFSSFAGRSYSDNPRYVSEKLHEVCPSAEIVWLFRDPDAVKNAPDYVEKVDMIKARAFRLLGGARVWVDNYAKRPYLYPFKKNQYYVQLWHGDRAFKKIGFDRPPVPKKLAEEHCALAVCASDYGEMQYRSALHYKGPLLREGYPRNDILVRNDEGFARKIRESLGVKEGTKLLLYAPTFRDSAGKNKQEVPLDLMRVIERLEKKTGENWLCLIRAHYLSAGVRAEDMQGKGVDVSAYPEMAELLLASDMLITDYSSCAGDFALTGRPILLYQGDIDKYRSKDRDMYFEMKDSPYLAAHDMEEMDALIDRIDDELARENDRAILDFYNTTETGRACEAVCEYIIDKLSL